MKWLVVALTLFSFSPLMSQELRSVSVTGQAAIEVVPDRARISIGVQAIDLDPQIAMENLAKQSQNIVGTILASGIEETDIQTTQISLQPFWRKQKREGFLASNRLSVEMSAIDEMPSILGALAKAGMTDLGGLQFFSSEQAAKEREAMLLSVEDARARAQALAQASGMNLGDPIAIDYHSNSGVRPMMMAKEVSLQSKDMAVKAGEVSISSQVNIRYELLPN